MKFDICLCGATMRTQLVSMSIPRLGQPATYALVCPDCGIQGPHADNPEASLAEWHKMQAIRWSGASPVVRP